MGQRLRVTLILLVALCMLVFAVMGLSAKLPISTGIVYVFYAEEDPFYHAYIVDRRHGAQIDLTGTECDPGPPSWAVSGAPENDPIVMGDSDGIYLVRRPYGGERCRL